VLVEQVDDIDAEPLEGGIRDRLDLRGPAVQAGLLALDEVEAELGGDHHLVTDRS